MNERIGIKVKKLRPDAVIPKYQTIGSAGFDFHSAEDICIGSGNQKIVKTGLSCEIPRGYELQIRPRSGLAAKNRIMVTNSPGTVDSDYRGEICVIISNFGGQDFIINKGDRIAQGIVAPIIQVGFEVVEDLATTERAAGGFGSTGKK